ncbi:hypothetical protein D9M71_61350 [compost metagenome]
MQQAEPVGDRLAGIVDAVEFVIGLGQRAGAQVLADRAVAAFHLRGFQQVLAEALHLADVPGLQQPGDLCELGDHRHVIAAVLRWDRVLVEQAPRIGMATHGGVGDRQRGQHHVAQEGVLHGRIAHGFEQFDGALGIVVLHGDGPMDWRQAAG